MFRSLLVRFIFGALLLVLLITSYIFFNYSINNLIKDINNELNVFNSLQVETTDLKQKSQQYKLNAPRDFESYNRDVAVYYTSFKDQLQAIEADVDILSTDIDDSILFIHQEFHQQVESLIDKNKIFISLWSEFSEEINREIGSKQEPRLEWAAEYVLANIDNIVLQTQVQNNKSLALLTQLENYRQLGNILLLMLLAIYFIASLFVVIFQVIRPVIKVAESCQEVASGEYGLQVPETGGGEVKALQVAFNQLSSRSQLMMELMNSSQHGDSTKEKINQIFKSGYQALGINWMGLMSLNGEQAQLMNSAPALLDDGWRHRTVSLHKTFGKELVGSFDKQWLQIRDISKLAIQRHDERFLRELHHNTLATEVAGFPFKCPQQHNFILLFSTATEGGFNQQQLKLLRSMTSQMADNIVGSFE